MPEELDEENGLNKGKKELEEEYHSLFIGENTWRNMLDTIQLEAGNITLETTIMQYDMYTLFTILSTFVIN